AGTNAHCIAQRHVDIFSSREWDGVEQFVTIAIHESEQSILSGCGNHIALLPVYVGCEYGAHLRQIPIVNVVGHSLEVPSHFSAADVERENGTGVEVHARPRLIVKIR